MLDRLAVTRFLPSPDTSIKRLAAAVLLRAIQDCKKEGFDGDDARRFLLEDRENFTFWCYVYGISPERVRQAVRRGVKAKISRRDVERAIRANPERSNNAIAKELGVHRERVRYWRLKMG